MKVIPLSEARGAFRRGGEGLQQIRGKIYGKLSCHDTPNRSLIHPNFVLNP